MSAQALRALKGVKLTPLERLLAAVLAERFEEWLGLKELIANLYIDAPLHAESSIAHISRKLSVKLQKSALRLERRHGLRRLTWRKDPEGA